MKLKVVYTPTLELSQLTNKSVSHSGEIPTSHLQWGDTNKSHTVGRYQQVTYGGEIPTSHIQ